MLGQQNETFPVRESGDWGVFHGGFRKQFLKSKGAFGETRKMRCRRAAHTSTTRAVRELKDGKLFEVKLMWFTDETRTERIISNPKWGPRHVIYTYEITDDPDVMVCTETCCFEDTGVVSEGWSYELRRVQNSEGARNGSRK
jgi:hypothetical protein